MPDTLFDDMAQMSDSALRSVLALIHLSFEFDQEKSTWVCPNRSFTRAEVEDISGLSGQGTRNGLQELEEAGYLTIDRSGRSFQHELAISVPERKFTYLPMALLKKDSGLKGTKLQVVLTVLTDTWGWTDSSDSSQSESSPKSESSSTGGNAESSSLEHHRWARLSTAELARRTGHSESAVKKAAQRLNGRYIERLRPDNRAYRYRFLPQALLPDEPADRGRKKENFRLEKPPVEKKIDAFFSVGLPNDLPPDRQRSAPPSSNIESLLKSLAKHSASSKRPASSPRSKSPSSRENALRGAHSSSPRETRRPNPKRKSPPPPENPSHQGRGPAGPSRRRRQPANRRASSSGRQSGLSSESRQAISGFSEKKRDLGQKLVNAGVSPRRVPTLLRRFSAERIEANFQYYRQEAATKEITNPGGWLYAAITEGYAAHSRGPDASGGPKSKSASQDRRPSVPEPGTVVSETRKRTLLRSGKAEEADFDRCKVFDDPDRPQHYYKIEATQPTTAPR